MNKILHIDSSPNLSKSFSRTYSKKVVEKIISIKGNYEILDRDLIKNQLPLVTEAWYSGAYKAEDQRSTEEVNALKISDSLIDELLSSEYVVVGCPMHNFGINAAFKLYIDQVCRVNKTWTLDYKGLVTKQKFIVVMTRGGGMYEVGEDRHNMNQQEPYIRTALGFIGVKEQLQFIKINNLAKPDKIAEELKTAEEQINNLKL